MSPSTAAAFSAKSNNGVVSYSRDGEFSLDANQGVIVNSEGAQNVTGYPASAAGTITSAPPAPLDPVPGVGSGTCRLGNQHGDPRSQLNLDSRATVSDGCAI